MNTSKTILIIVVIVISAYAAFQYKKAADENQLIECVATVLQSLDIDSIQIDAKNRINSPIIRGKTTTKNKQKLINFIEQKCGIQAFEDLIEENNDFDIKVSNINFTLDGFNQIASITGMVNSVFEQKEILQSFTQAVNTYFGPWTIQHEILVSKKVNKNEFAIDITLIFTAISSVRATDITLINDQLILKGYVRNKEQLDQTLLQLTQIFQEELEIVNQIIPVLKNEKEINQEKIEIDPIKIPIIKPPSLPEL